MRYGMLVMLAMVPLFVGCQGDERLSEVSTVQTEAQLQKEKDFKEARAREMEADLSKRQLFFQGVAGNYEGTVTTTDGEYAIRIRLVPSVPPYKPGERVRTTEEVLQDISNLYFRAQIVQWKKGSPLGVIGCRVDNVRPDLAKGTISVASPECPSFYDIFISQDAPPAGTNPDVETQMISDGAKYIAESLLGGKLNNVPQLIGKVFPTSSASAFKFSATRKDEQ